MPPVTPRATAAAMADAYEDYAPLIRQVVERFCRRYRAADFDETVAEANYQFLIAYHTFDRRRGTTVEQRVQRRVWCALVDGVRTEWGRRGGRPKRVRWVGDPVAVPPAPTFDRGGLDAAVAPDASVVVELVLDTPAELLAAIRAAPRPDALRVRRLVKQWCVGRLGWPEARYYAAVQNLMKKL